MGPDSVRDVEEEITLVVCSLDAEHIFRELCLVESLGGCRLGDVDQREIRDVYLDLPDRALMRAGWALRVRREGDRRLLVLKGRERRTTWGATKRVEIEAPWTREAVKGVMEATAREGITLPDVEATFDRFTPVECLLSVGFEVLQDRETFRRIRKIFTASNHSAEGDAELCLDRVTYKVMGRDAVHYEVEIETRTGEGTSAAKNIVAALEDLFPKDFMVWPHNKLLTGLAMERLAQAGGWEGPENFPRPLPTMYTAIDRVLQEDGSVTDCT